MADNKQNQKAPEKPSSRVKDYLRANLLFWGFLAVAAFVSFFACGGVLDDVFKGVLEFIFLILGCGFTLVSMLDYLYDEYTQQQSPEKK